MLRAPYTLLARCIPQELDIIRRLIASYAAAKPSIDACNAGFEDAADGDEQPVDTFSDYEQDWEDDWSAAE